MWRMRPGPNGLAKGKNDRVNNQAGAEQNMPARLINHNFVSGLCRAQGRREPNCANSRLDSPHASVCLYPLSPVGGTNPHLIYSRCLRTEIGATPLKRWTEIIESENDHVVVPRTHTTRHDTHKDHPWLLEPKTTKTRNNSRSST